MNAQITLVFILTLTGSCIGYHVWTTTYDEPFEIFCGEPEMLTSMTSIHSDGNEDRKWEFVCDSTSLSYMLNRQLQCSWSGYINDYDQPAIYQCSQTGFIQGIKSVHHNGAEDRRWDFYCCSSPAYSVTDCRYTSQLNRYDKPLQYYIPDGYVLHGAISVHHDGAEDRIFWFEICRLKMVKSS